MTNTASAATPSDERVEELEDPHATFASNVKYLRKVNDLTQDELARKADLTTAAVTSIEVGRRKVRIDEAVAIAGVFGVTVEALLDPDFQGAGYAQGASPVAEGGGGG